MAGYLRQGKRRLYHCVGYLYWVNFTNVEILGNILIYHTYTYLVICLGVNIQGIILIYTPILGNLHKCLDIGSYTSASHLYWLICENVNIKGFIVIYTHIVVLIDFY